MSIAPEHDVIELLRDADPAPAETVRRGMSPEAHAEARERAMGAGESAEGRHEALPAPSRRSRRFGIGTVSVGAALAGAVIAAVALLGGSPVGPGDQPAFAGAAVEVAEANPRLLIDAPGWSVIHADELDPESGFMEFGDGEARVTLTWTQTPAEVPVFDYTDPSQLSTPELDQWYASPVSCLSRGGELVECNTYVRNTEVEVLGDRAILSESRSVYRDRQGSSFTVLLPPEGRANVTLTANSISRAALLQALASLRAVDVETWLGALPPRIVQPLERPEVVDEMLADVPIPASVDVEELKGELSAASRYHLGAAVTGAVACGWLDQWAAAIESGDAGAEDAATEAMMTSMDWAILQEMDEQGGWSRTIWEYAREMRDGERQALLGSSGTESYPDGSVYETSPSYAGGVGCDSERRTLVREPGGDPRPGGGRLVPVPAPVAP